MGFNLKIEGESSLTYGKEIIQMVNVALSSPSEAKAKSTHNYATMWINGKLNIIEGATEGDSDTIELFKWAQEPAGSEQAYRDVTVEVETTSQCYRKINFNKAFVVDYSERYSDNAGVGVFTLILRQKADKVDDVDVIGGTPLEEDAFGAGGQETGDGQVSAAADQAAAMAAPQSPATGGFAANAAKQNAMQATIENTMRSTAASAMQKTLQKADPSGTAAAVMQSAMQGVQAIQSPETVMQNEQVAKIMQKESFNEQSAKFATMTTAKISNFKE